MKKYKFSIITPTHKNSDFLLELYESINKQSYSNWEWILYLNGDCNNNLIDEKILEDKRVFIYDSKRKFRNIGEVKHNAFKLGKGDILVDDSTYRGQYDFEGTFMHFGKHYDWDMVVNSVETITNLPIH